MLSATPNSQYLGPVTTLAEVKHIAIVVGVITLNTYYRRLHYRRRRATMAVVGTPH